MMNYKVFIRISKNFTLPITGMIYFYGKKEGGNAPAVQTCLNLGAVPFCKTNIPQVNSLFQLL